MSLFIPARRATLLLPSPSVDDPNRKHLFIILTDPVGDKQEVLLVSASSVKKNLPHDTSCLLYPGDHEFIRHPSYVVYNMPRIETAPSLIKGAKLGQLIPKGMIGEDVFTRICQGLLDSTRTPLRIKRFYESSRQRS